MSRKIALFCALIGIVAFVASPAYADVQNIKISGDIEVFGVYRDNYDLEDGRVVVGDGSYGDYLADDTDSFFMSVVRLRVDADLTDNVSACVGLANLREWDADTHTADNDDRSIILTQANITLKEMLYSPLTLVIGRQGLQYGNGLIIGPGRYGDPNTSIKYNDLSPLHGYDAIRAILDYDPWTLDLIAVKIEEGDDALNATATRDRDSDTDLYGANLGYKFANYEAEMEGYCFAKRDESYDLTVNATGSPSDGRTFEENEVYTFGIRGSFVPADNFTLSGELAGQWGEISDQQAGPDDLPLTRDRDAMMGNAAAEYAFVNTRFSPVLGGEYLYLSGEESGSAGDYEAWDPMYRGKIMGNIRDYLENLYTTNDPTDTSGWTNQHTVKATCGLDLGELVDGLSLDMAYLHYWFDEEPVAAADNEIGNEVNMKLTYDYTEDVQFALDSAWFIPGDYYGKELHPDGTRTANDDALSIVGSCKVTF